VHASHVLVCAKDIVADLSIFQGRLTSALQILPAKQFQRIQSAAADGKVGTTNTRNERTSLFSCFSPPWNPVITLVRTKLTSCNATGCTTYQQNGRGKEAFRRTTVLNQRRPYYGRRATSGPPRCFMLRLTAELSRAMAQVVSRRPLIAESRVRVQVNQCGICGGKSGTGTVFSQSSLVFLCQYYSTVILHTHISSWDEYVSLWQQFRDSLTPSKTYKSTTEMLSGKPS
jgi:hypothetical protein